MLALAFGTPIQGLAEDTRPAAVRISELCCSTELDGICRAQSYIGGGALHGGAAEHAPGAGMLRPNQWGGSARSCR